MKTDILLDHRRTGVKDDHCKYFLVCSNCGKLKPLVGNYFKISHPNLLKQLKHNL